MQDVMDEKGQVLFDNLTWFAKKLCSVMTSDSVFDEDYVTIQAGESFFVYYESIKREPKIRGIYECRCDERLQTKSKEFTRLAYTGLVLELEHLKT